MANDGDSGDPPSKSRWLAPGVLERARELTEGIHTPVVKPPPAAPAPEKPDPDRREASEWASESPGETNRRRPGDKPQHGAEQGEPDPGAWTPASRQPSAAAPRPASPASPSYPAQTQPKRFQPAPAPRTPLSRRVRNLTLRSQATAPLTPRWIAGAVAVVMAAGVVGLVVGRSGADDEPQTVSTPAFVLTLPGDWNRRPAASEARPLALAGAIAAGPAGQAGAGIVAGTLPPSASPALPGVARPLDPTPPRADLVRLGRRPAYRYEGLRRPGSDRVSTLYVIPRRGDSLAIACFAPGARASSFLGACAATATTIVPTGAAGADRESLERYLDRAGAVVNRLGASRVRARSALARAQTPKQQALAAKRLVRDYRRAAARLDRIPGSRPAGATVRPLIRDLRATASGYRRLAVAAAEGSPRSFVAARSAIRRGEAAIQRRLATL